MNDGVFLHISKQKSSELVEQQVVCGTNNTLNDDIQKVVPHNCFKYNLSTLKMCSEKRLKKPLLRVLYFDIV